MKHKKTIKKTCKNKIYKIHQVKQTRKIWKQNIGIKVELRVKMLVIAEKLFLLMKGIYIALKL